jgi:hypothetical protein
VTKTRRRNALRLKNAERHQHTADSGTGSIAIQDAPHSSAHRKNAVAPAPAIHALVQVQMKGKERNTKMDAKTEGSPASF